MLLGRVPCAGGDVGNHFTTTWLHSFICGMVGRFLGGGVPSERGKIPHTQPTTVLMLRVLFYYFLVSSFFFDFIFRRRLHCSCVPSDAILDARMTFHSSIVQ